MKRIAIYTACFGGKDKVRKPAILPNADYYCFTDHPENVPAPWKPIPITVVCKTRDQFTRLARQFKICVQDLEEIWGSYKHSLWIDANITTREGMVEWLKIASKCDIGAFVHSIGTSRDCVYDEGEHCAEHRRDNPGVIRQQLDRYRKMGYPEHNGLWMTGVLYRQHTYEVGLMMDIWWSEVERGSRRDQLSFPVVLHDSRASMASISPANYWHKAVLRKPHKVDDEGVSTIEKRWDVLNALIEKFGYKSYLEIGSRNNHCLDQVKCDHKVGVDPEGKPTYKMTSDEFFDNHVCPNKSFDLIFIDGLHEHYTVQGDIINSFAVMKDGGTIVVHDTNPPTELHQRVPRTSILTMFSLKEWTGDGWRAVVDLRQVNQANVFTIDVDWGCSVIRKEKNFFPITIPDVVRYEDLDKNRKKWLNLITVEEFVKWLDSMPS